MQLSIIVPVYNVERYLRRCLDSLLRQGMGEAGDSGFTYEVICVNDGSTDGSAQILAEYAARHPNTFKVITQENLGLGLTRDAGLQVAQGEYVGFLDADDYVIDGAYRFLYEHFCHNRPDVLSFTYRHIETDGKCLLDPAERPQGEVVFEGDGVEVYNRQNLDFQWTKFYRRAFLQEHHVRFQPLLYFEDERFNFDVFQASPSLVMTNCNMVRWEQNHLDSLMHTTNRDRVLQHMDALLDLLAQMNAYLQDGNTLLSPAAQRVIYNVLNHFYKKSFSIRLSFSEWRVRMRRLKSQPLHRMDLGASRMEKIVDWTKNMMADTYWSYLLLRFLHLRVIRRMLA